VGTANLMPQDWAFKTQTFYHFAAPFVQITESLNENKVNECLNGKNVTTSQKSVLNFLVLLQTYR
jgi:hypothetical protein